MGLKKYIFGTLLFLIILAGYTFSLNSGDYRVEIFGTGIVLPVALWVTLPVLVFFILSFLHILFYGVKKYFYIRSLNKDEQTLVELVSDIMLKKESKKHFKTDPYKEISLVLSQLNLTIKDSNFHSNVKELMDVADKVLKINSGTYISSKELKLPNDNELMQKNLINKIAIDDNFALELIKNPADYGEEIVKKAFLKVLDTKDLATSKRYISNIKLDKDMVLALLDKDAATNEEANFTNTEIIELVKPVGFKTKDYIHMINQYKNRMLPDQIIKLLEDLSVDSEEATEAYLYVLFEYEMIDEARSVINGSGPNDYKPYKALLDLKDAGKHYNLDHTSYIK